MAEGRQVPMQRRAMYRRTLPEKLCATGAAAVAAVAKQRRHLGQIREHPYQRAGALS